MRSSLRLIETYNRLGNPFRFLWTFGGFDVELLSLQFEVVVCDEQVNNSLDMNTETEVQNIEPKNQWKQLLGNNW